MGTDITGAEPGTGDVTCDVGSKPGTGDPILEPGMEVVIGNSDAEPGTGFTTGKQAQLLNCSNIKVPSAVAVQPPAAGSAANYDSDTVSGDSDLDTLDYQSSRSTVDGKGSSGGRQCHLVIPASMCRQLNCIRTVQRFKLSGGIFNLLPWMNRHSKQLCFTYQLTRGKGCRNCPGLMP